jgi:hypothetical protein
MLRRQPLSHIPLCRRELSRTARNLLLRPPHRKRREPGRAPGSEGVRGERGVEKRPIAPVPLLRRGDFPSLGVVEAVFIGSSLVRDHDPPL